MKKILNLLIITLITLMTLNSCKTGKTVDKSNPFFSEFDTPFNVPAFDKIKAKHYLPAFEKGIADGRKEVELIVSNKETPTFENTIVAFDNAGELLSNVRAVFFAQASANTSDSLQKIEVDISPKLAAYDDEIRMNPGLFKKVKYIYDNQSGMKLNPDQAFILENLYKGFVRNGANLNKQDQDSLKKLNQDISLLSVKFSQNILNETNDYKLFLGPEDVKDLPLSLTAAAAEAAKGAGQEGKFLFNTQRPSIFPFITYSSNRELRHKLFDAYINRGNNGNENDNNKIFADLVALRAAHAKILGYRTHADYVLEPRMAKNPENVFKLLNGLWDRAIPVAKKEVKEMQSIIDKEGGKFKLEPYDWWYYSEKLRKQKYDLNDEELKPYFSLDNVVSGVLTCANKLFGITFTPLNNIPLPHPDAKAFEVKDSDGSHLGVLYMDFHTRESKRQGAWCGSYRSHHIKDAKVITPVVTTVFNFPSANGDIPALLDLDEVSTIFHEFGHALDGLFNKNPYNSSYIAWDFVELPSQLNEHWATEPQVLKMYAKNYKTGEIIPEALIKKISNSGYFNQGFANVEVLAASMLDMAYHILEAPVKINVQDFEKEYLTRIGLIPEIVSRYRTTYFAHLTDGYDAGYYCYKWAAVLDNDAFEAFKEKGIFDQATALSYRRNILEKNGTMDPMQMFVNFRGREPEIEPLLKNSGLMN
jgi:peptidyl-dipeptidase Dcp